MTKSIQCFLLITKGQFFVLFAGEMSWLAVTDVGLPRGCGDGARPAGASGMGAILAKVWRCVSQKCCNFVAR